MEDHIVHMLLSLLIATGAVAGIVGAVSRIRERRDAHSAKDEPARHRWDPLLCSHVWHTTDTGECENTYSSYGGGVERQQWWVECCERCGSVRFHCSDSSCLSLEECRRINEAGSAESGPIEREPQGRVADKNGFEYMRYLLRDRFGNERTAYCRVIPTTYPFACPDCGGMVVGVDARRVWPGTAGPEPTAFRCEGCGREENHEFGIPRVEYREAEPNFAEPAGMQPVCPKGGKHEWEVLESWSETDFPEGVDSCLENLSFLEERHFERRRCGKCGEVKVERLDG